MLTRFWVSNRSGQRDPFLIESSPALFNVIADGRTEGCMLFMSMRKVQWVRSTCSKVGMERVANKSWGQVTP